MYILSVAFVYFYPLKISKYLISNQIAWLKQSNRVRGQFGKLPAHFHLVCKIIPWSTHCFQQQLLWCVTLQIWSPLSLLLLHIVGLVQTVGLMSSSYLIGHLKSFEVIIIPWCIRCPHKFRICISTDILPRLQPRVWISSHYTLYCVLMGLMTEQPGSLGG